MKVSIIGAGQMGEALTKGLIASGAFNPSEIMVSDIRRERTSFLKKAYGVEAAENNIQAVEKGDIIIFAVKPQQLNDVLEEITSADFKKKILVSIVAGIPTSYFCQKLGEEVELVRVMPNTPALIGRGMSVISLGKNVSSQVKDVVERVFKAVGEVIFLDEKYQNEAMALSGCGPAYFYYFVESLVEAGLKAGLPREISTKLVVETLIGAGYMLKETGKHPALLIDMVTSPGGTTIAALEAFEEEGLKRAIFKGVKKAIKRAKEMG